MPLQLTLYSYNHPLCANYALYDCDVGCLTLFAEAISQGIWHFQEKLGHSYVMQ